MYRNDLAVSIVSDRWKSKQTVSLTILIIKALRTIAPFFFLCVSLPHQNTIFKTNDNAKSKLSEHNTGWNVVTAHALVPMTVLVICANNRLL